MNTNRRRWLLPATVTVAVLAATGLAAPAVAEQSDADANAIEDTVQSLASIDGTGPIDEAVEFDETPDGALIYDAERAALSIEAGDSPTIELASDGDAPLWIDGALPGVAETAEDGAAVFVADEEYAVTPLPHADGSVQIVTVLESAQAPERFDYDLSSTTSVQLKIGENGAVVVLDDNGSWLGGVAAPWAYDANGATVPTHFEVEGSRLVQVVDHQSGDFAYPISADPYGGKNLWGWHSVDYYNGDQRVNLRLSDWGRTMAYPWVLIDYGWPEALARSASVKNALTSKGTMRQQFDCHAFGSAFAGDWNLERFRPTRTVVWSSGVAVHRCNWTTPNLN